MRAGSGLITQSKDPLRLPCLSMLTTWLTLGDCLSSLANGLSWQGHAKPGFAGTSRRGGVSWSSPAQIPTEDVGPRQDHPLRKNQKDPGSCLPMVLSASTFISVRWE